MVEKLTMVQINAFDLKCIAYGINGAGGGGNVKELYNPTESGIVGLVQEIGSREVPFYTAEMLRPDDSVCCVARLGKPGAKADSYANKASLAIVNGLRALSSETGLPFPKAIVPVEATAGQMARAIRAALAAQATGNEVAILDGDVCGGIAVPAIPLAFNITSSMAAHPQVALIQLVMDNDQVVPSVEMITETKPEKLEAKLRKMAGDSEMGAVWFAWLMTKAGDFNRYFTPKSVSSSIERGRIVEEAVKNGRNPAEDLLKEGEIDRIVTTGTVVSVIDESKQAPGFAQFFYELETPSGPMNLAARNEYIIMYLPDGTVVCKAPKIISVLGKEGPIQSHVLKAGDEISVVVATPQALINKPESKSEWNSVWEKYWAGEQKKGTWKHPY